MAKDMYQKRSERQKNQKNEYYKEKRTNINWYPGHMAKAKREISEKLDLVDIIYEVIDARIPFSSKIVDINNLVKNKPRILIMTKYDLCDKEVTNKFVNQYKSLGYKVLCLDLTLNNTKELITLTNELLYKITEDRIKKGLLKRNYRALVLGIPNVGKSTLINRLALKNITKVGNMPGITKGLSWIKINQNIMLLDTPGILWPKIDNDIVGFNLAAVASIKDEVIPKMEVANYIIRFLGKNYSHILNDCYSITSVDADILKNYDIIGQKRGALLKGGIIDYDKVYNIVLNDIKTGKLKGVTFDVFKE